MPRLSNSQPKYRMHKASGQAIVTLDGKDFYLGPHGTKTSHSKYDRLVGIWQQNGRKLPTTSLDTSVVELCAAFWRHAKQHYGKDGRPTDEQASFRVCIRYLRQMYGPQPCGDLGPLALSAIRSRMIDADNSRKYINKQVSRIRLIFKWGVANELAPVETYPDEAMCRN